MRQANVATFTPTSNLAPSATYTATISTGVKDLGRQCTGKWRGSESVDLYNRRSDDRPSANKSRFGLYVRRHGYVLDQQHRFCAG